MRAGVLVLVACGAGPEAGVPAVDTELPVVDTEPEVLEPPADDPPEEAPAVVVPDLGPALEAAVREAVALDPGQARDVWRRLETFFGDDCTDRGTSEHGYSVLVDCADGPVVTVGYLASDAGAGRLLDEEDAALLTDWLTSLDRTVPVLGGVWVLGRLSVRDPHVRARVDGRFERLNDGAGLTVHVANGAVVDDAVSDGWVGRALQPEGLFVANVAGHWRLQGALGGLEHGTAAFDGLRLDPDCPVGQVALRGDDGVWWEVDFACAPCATVSLAGTVHGELCVDPLAWVGP